MKVKRAELGPNSHSAAFANGTLVQAATRVAVTQWTRGTGVDPDAQTAERRAVEPLYAELERLDVSVDETLWFSVANADVPDLVVTLRTRPGARRLLYVDVAGVIELIEPDAVTGARTRATPTRFSVGRRISPPPLKYATSELGSFFLAVVTLPSGSVQQLTDLGLECTAAARRVFGGSVGVGEPPSGSVAPRVARPLGRGPVQRAMRGVRAPATDGGPTRGSSAPPPGFTRSAPRRAAATPPVAPRPAASTTRAARAEPLAAGKRAAMAKPLAAAKRLARAKPPTAIKRAARAEKPEVSVTRRPNIDFHELVVAGTTHPLVVRLSEAITAEELEQAFAVAVAAGKDTVTLSVTLSAPGFVVLPERELPLTVGRLFSKKREQVKFTLKALEPAGAKPVKRDIRADIWLGNASIGGVTHWTTVVPKGYKGRATPSGESRSSPFEISNPGRECELVIRVQGRDELGSPPYDVSLRSRIPHEPEYESRRVGAIDFSRKELIPKGPVMTKNSRQWLTCSATDSV